MKEAIPGSVRSTFAPVLQEIIDVLGVRFVEPSALYKMSLNPMPVSSGGFWEPVKDFITVRDCSDIRWRMMGGSVDQQDYLLMHELIHWTGHPDRLCRQTLHKVMTHGSLSVLTRIEYDTEEMTAEMGMFKLAKALGLDPGIAQSRLEKYYHTHPMANMGWVQEDSDKAVTWILSMFYGYSNASNNPKYG